MLNMLERGIAIDCFIDLSSGWGKLFGPVFLLMSDFVIISSISVGEVGLIISEWGLGFFRKAR